MGRHERMAELAEIDRDGLVVADVACGTGRVVRALLAGDPAPARVHALDVVSDLDDDVLADERVISRLADPARPSPLATASVDRVVSLNVVEHLPDHTFHLADAARILVPGGLMVLAHSDWDTILFTSPDDGLTRELVDRFVAERPHGDQPADGFMGRKLVTLDSVPRPAFVDLDHPPAPPLLERVGLHSWADSHTRFDAESVAWKVATGMLAAARDDPHLTARAAGWVDGMRKLAAERRFLFTVTDVAVVLRRNEIAVG